MVVVNRRVVWLFQKVTKTKVKEGLAALFPAQEPGIQKPKPKAFGFLVGDEGFEPNG